MKKYLSILFLLVFLLAPALSFATPTDLYTPGDIDPNPISNCINIINNLRYRDRDVSKNGEVSTLQDFLQSKKYLNNEPTGYFGIMTFQAVKDFQKANYINPTGYVGTLTKDKIKSLTCSEVKKTTICEYAAPSQGCTYIKGEKYDDTTGCGMILKCPEKNTSGVIITSPARENAIVSSPLTVSGYTTTKNGWGAFEGQVGSVKLVDASGATLASGPLSATTDWMKTPVSFSTVLTFTKVVATGNIETGALIFKSENASGDPIYDKEYKFPVRFSGIVNDTNLPDLTVGATVPVVTTANLSTKYTAIVKNIGKAEALGPIKNSFQFDFYKTGNDEDNNGMTSVGTASGGVAVNGNTSISASYTAPSSGTLYVRACADNDSAFLGTVKEVNENNNCGPWVIVKVENAAKKDIQTLESGDDINGKHIGSIKNIFLQGDKNYLVIDYVQWITSCVPDTAKDYCLNGYTVLNTNSLLRTLPIAKDVVVKLQTYSHDVNGANNWNQVVPFTEFETALNNSYVEMHPAYLARNILFWITLKSGVITEITEQYQP